MDIEGVVVIALVILAVSGAVTVRFYRLIQPQLKQSSSPPSTTQEIKDALYSKIEPYALITGLAATILIIIARPGFNLDSSSGIGIAIAVLALAGLFIIKNRLIKP